MAIPALPSNWSSFLPGDKVTWFKNNGVTTYDLLQAGWINPSEIYWFEERGMGDGKPPKSSTNPVQENPVYYDPEPVYENTSNTVIANPYETDINFVASRTTLPRDVIYQRIISGENPFSIVDSFRAEQVVKANSGLLGDDTSATTNNTSTNTGGATQATPSYLDSSGNVIEQPRNTAQDAVTLMAAQLGLGLPNEWQYYDAKDRVNWFNANKITEQTLRDYKVPEADIAYAKQLGLGTETAAPPSWNLPTGMTLPSDWAKFTGKQKVDWYNQNKVTADMLRAMGVPETDVQGAITLGLGKTTASAGTTQPTRTFNPADYMPPTFNLPATNFVPFTTGGGQTSLAAPTTGFFYKTTPTEQVPFQFQSGAAGYTNLRPMTLEFGIPQAVSQVQQFQPGYFNQAGILQNYDWAKTNTQLAQQAAQKAQQAANEQVQSGAAMGGKIVGFTDYEEKPDGEVGYEKGGKIRSLLGPNPDGPDEGYAKLQRGEYVVRRKAVNKYGEDFLEALNEARMPKEKLKSLL